MSEHKPTVRVTGPAGLLSAVAGLLGFHPTDSVVVVCRRGGVAGPIMRVDVDGFNFVTAAYLADQAAQFCDEVAVVSYSADPVNAPVDLTELCAQLVARDVRVFACLAADNRPQPVDEAIKAMSAMTGRAILASRDEVAASIRYAPAVDVSQQVENLIHRARITDVRDLSAEFVCLPDGGARNALPDLIAAVRQVPADDDAAPVLAVVLGFVAYIAGDGALAQLAADRADEAVPGYGPAHALVAVMTAGITPTQLIERFRAGL